MTDKSAPIHDAGPLARLLAIGNRAAVLSSVLAKDDISQSSLTAGVATLAGLLIDLSAVVADVYGEHQLALRRSAEAPA